MDLIGKETLKRMSVVKSYNLKLLSLFKEILKGEVLEIGSGIGNFSKLISQSHDLWGIDYNSDYIKTLKKSRIKANFGFGDIEKGKYFFGKKQFDSIVCLNVLEHIKDDHSAVKNMFKLLKSGGKVFLLTPAHQFFYGEIDEGLGHYRRYSQNSLSQLFYQNGFNVEKTFYFNWFGGLGWFVNSRLLHRKILPSEQLKLFEIVSKPLLFIERFVKPPFGLSVCIIASKSK